MLLGLSIRNVVLIDQLDLEIGNGLCVLTGETGAGKSILLDSLGLALGYRSERGLLRADKDQASVSAQFQVDEASSVNKILQEQDIEIEDTLILRRTLGQDGRSRAFINGQPVNISLLRRIGSQLVEIEGQFAEQGLLDPANHRETLDSFGGHLDLCGRLRAIWQEWRKAFDVLEKTKATIASARQEEEDLKHAVSEIEALDPASGEEEELAKRRALLMNSEKLTGALSAAARELGIDGGTAASASDRLRMAAGHLEKATNLAPEKFADLALSLDRAIIELGEAESLLTTLGNELDSDPKNLETIEERLFTLRDVARKHGIEVEALPELREKLSARLEAIRGGEENLKHLSQAEETARSAYLEAAKTLSEKRHNAALKLDQAVIAELPALKLEKAVFKTRLDPLSEDEMGETGGERISFEISTNPGMPLAPLGKVASGGELARFMLALKVVTAGASNGMTLIFDEVDSGVGGAVSAAVGERLARLGQDRQVLVITHSPQVAAMGQNHLRVEKSASKDDSDKITTSISALSGEDRKEEIARMLAGAQITDEARAAADKLLQAG